jgi:predicted esterase
MSEGTMIVRRRLVSSSRFLVAALSASLALLFVRDACAQAGFTEYSLDSAKTKYQVLVPAKCTSDKKWPAVLLLHGKGQNALDFGKTWEKAATEKSHVLISLQCPGNNWKFDQLPIVASCLEDAKKNAPVDPAKVILAGFADGGTLAIRAAVENKDLFRAVATVAGVLSPSTPKDFVRAAKGVMVYLACGASEDAQVIKDVRMSYDEFKSEGYTTICREIQKTGHEFPPGEPLEIINWVDAPEAYRIFQDILDRGAAAMTGGFYRDAAALFKQASEMPPSPACADEAKAAMEKLSRVGDNDIAKAAEKTKAGEFEAAADILCYVLAAYGDLPQGKKAKTEMDGLRKKAPKLQETFKTKEKAAKEKEGEKAFNAAGKLEADKKPVEAYEAYEKTALNFSDTSWAKKAREKSKAIADSDPELKKKITEAKNEKECAKLMSQAENFVKNKQVPAAITTFKKVVALAPNSAYAKQAEARIKELEGKK